MRELGFSPMRSRPVWKRHEPPQEGRVVLSQETFRQAPGNQRELCVWGWE